MIVEDLIQRLLACNPKAEVSVIAHCRSYPFSLTVGGGSDGMAWKDHPEVNFYVDQLCGSETENS